MNVLRTPLQVENSTGYSPYILSVPSRQLIYVLETFNIVLCYVTLSSGVWTWRTVLWVAIGWIVGISLGMLCCIYVATLHENDLWFSNIKEVEREISFRTECGLYYSYYKQMLRAPSIQQGLSELISDNATESKRTINLLRRMNIYQEVFLGVLYRILPIQAYLEPVYFYIYTVFSLQAVYVIALFITSWLLSGSWLAGALTGVWYILNRVDTTRVEFTVSLRENWSLPFFALQIAAITCYLRPHLKPIQQKVVLWLMFLATLCFCLTWQFNQFILLVQALIIFTLDCLDLISTEQVTCLYLVQVSSLLSVWLLQFCNSMILGSLALSFIVAALFVKHFQVRPNTYHMFLLKPQGFDWFILQDFDASLYLCEEAFGLLPLDTFDRLAGTLPRLYVLCINVILSDSSAVGRPQKGRGEARPICMRADVAYNLLHTVFFGLLALGTMRMKYLWTGHMCAFAAYGVCGKELWSLCLNMIHCNTKTKLRLIRYTLPLVILCFLYHKFWPKLMTELSELREFYDPDTVELMTWISSKTPKKAVFAGSMQLLAGIKLCTGRVLTNHPHYEDRALRERTRQVYQIYAHQSPEEVHGILRTAGADFVVMEDSICYERRHGRGCRLRDLLDLANGHIMDGPGDNDPDLVHASHPRFCESVKTDGPAYTALFTRVFQNKTFHVYKLRRGKKRAKGDREPVAMEDKTH
uniref:Dpy-19 like C-mannosyltransferase 3 n=1 Tax=Salmo trutta TaxID=8032 RepID=A0A674A2N2_SALTR